MFRNENLDLFSRFLLLAEAANKGTNLELNANLVYIFFIKTNHKIYYIININDNCNKYKNLNPFTSV